MKLPVDMAAVGAKALRASVGDTEVAAGPDGVVAVARLFAMLDVPALLPAGVKAPNGWVATATGVDVLGAGIPAACPTPQGARPTEVSAPPEAKGDVDSRCGRCGRRHASTATASPRPS